MTWVSRHSGTPPLLSRNTYPCQTSSDSDVHFSSNNQLDPSHEPDVPLKDPCTKRTFTTVSATKAPPLQRPSSCLRIKALSLYEKV